MCRAVIINEQKPQQQQQQQQQQCSIWHLRFLHENEPFITYNAQSQEQKQQQQHHQHEQQQPQAAHLCYVSKNDNNNNKSSTNCHCLNITNINKRMHAPASNNNKSNNNHNENSNDNSNNNSINTKYTLSCGTRAKAQNSMPAARTATTKTTSTVFFNNNMKLQLFILAVFCAALGPNLVNGAPNRRLGHHLLLHKRSLSSTFVNRESSGANMNLQKIRDDIQGALNQTQSTADSLEDLSKKYYLHEYNSTKTELDKLWGWHAFQLNTPFQGRNETEEVDLNDLEKIKKELQNIHLALKVLEFMYFEAKKNRTNNSDLNKYVKNHNEHIKQQIDDFFELSFKFVRLELRNIRAIMSNFEEPKAEWEHKLKSVEYNMAHPKMHYALSTEHTRIMKIIKGYYTEFLKRLDEQL